jgi:DNA repair exonuclease SbcCD nuclease subunit
MFGFRSNIRKHGWEKDIDNKINQIIEYMLNNKIKYVFFTGDVFEKNKKADWSFNQLQENKARLKRFKNNGLQLFSNIGNHDYFYGKETLEGTVFGEMVEAGLINYIGSGMPPITFNVDDYFNVNLFGIDYHQSTDKIIDEMTRISQIACQPKIVLMHSNITDTNEIMTDFTYNQIAEFNFEIVGCGHWHFAPKNGAVQQVKNTYFLNPWNLTRVVRDYHVKLDEHKPEFIHGKIIKVGNEFTYDFKEIFLSVKPFSEAFNKEIINILQELNKTDFSFFNEIKLDEENTEMDDDSLLSQIAKENNFNERVLTIAKELLT